MESKRWVLAASYEAVAGKVSKMPHLKIFRRASKDDAMSYTNTLLSSSDAAVRYEWRSGVNTLSFIY